MSTTRVVKQAGPFLQGIEYDANLRTGRTTTITYRGSQAECKRQRDIEAGRGAGQTNLRPLQTGDWELRAVYPLDISATGGGGASIDPPVDMHELEINAEQPDVFTNLRLRAVMTDAHADAVKSVIDSYNQGKYGKGSAAVTAAQAEITTNTSGESSQCLALFDLVALRGTHGFEDEHTVYKRTITASTPQQVKVAYTGVGYIWTSPEIARFEKLPPVFYFALSPTSVWLKSKPRVTTVYGQKTQISYSYREAVQWSSLLYPAYGSAVAHSYFWKAS